ncbi:cell cycle and apoptosis regulator protein 2 isoform X1 [Electrophorus electricus]|nr:cell cycle and apoptosis regulator protein 2 isoform X1 [Electrophorus electricus]
MWGKGSLPFRGNAMTENVSEGSCWCLGNCRKQADMDTQMRQRVFTGVVTQLQDHHGMVDQEVRFPMSVVVGRVPLLGEKVLVKAVQDPLQPVSWTAQRVQALNGQPFKSPPPLLPSMSTNMKPGILGNKPQPLLKSPKIPPLIPSMQSNPGGMHQMPHHQQLPWTPPFDGWGVGNRKRHNEVVGGRRGGRWEEGGTPWSSDSTHLKRRRWRAPAEEEMPRRSSSVVSQSAPLFSRFPRDSQACGTLELRRRYPHLHAPATLFHLQLCWPESFPPRQPLPLARSCLYHMGPSQPPGDTTAPKSDRDDTSFSVKVMLLSMPGMEDFYAQCCSGTEDGQAHGDTVHPTTLFKFLLLERNGELELPGGLWSSKVDGSSPGKDSSALLRTAVRCVKEQTALDLTACTQWHKMAELRLLSGDKMETVVIFMPDVWNLVQTAEEWAKSREEQKADEPPLPDTPALVVQPSAGLGLSVISLSSLLGPQSSPTCGTFEVCLASELFSEMLQRDFGLQLYHSLCSLPQGPSAPRLNTKLEENDAPLKDEPDKADKQAKKKASDDGKKKTKEECQEGEEVIVKEELDQPECHTENRRESKSQEGGDEDLASGISDSPSLKDNDGPLGQCEELPRKVLLSWVFFDRLLIGHLREQDMQDILLSLGLYLAPAQAQNLVRKASVGGRCLYRKLCSRWVDPDEVDRDLSAEGNKGLLPGTPTKERGSTRRSTGSMNSDVVAYKGSILNVPNLLQSLESSKAAQHELERQLASLQARLEAAEAKRVSQQQEQLKSSLEEAESLNRTYEKSLKENAGHMLAVIEKMQMMIDQTTLLTRAKEVKEVQD